jgi:hypothetical protein
MDEEKIHPCHLLPHQSLQQKVPEEEEDTLLQMILDFFKSFTVSLQKVDGKLFHLKGEKCPVQRASKVEPRSRIFKLFRSPGIDSKNQFRQPM